jgi:hypothetical protein
MTIYSMALAYRGLLALLPFALLLVAVLGFLRMDAFPVWLAGLGASRSRCCLLPPGARLGSRHGWGWTRSSSS